jgi:glycerol uptake facilitator-like aquaporin
MPDETSSRQVVAEFLGTAMLVCAVVGSGIMAERLAGGNQAVALLANTVATGAALYVLILTFAPLSGAHFNPVVTIAALIRREASVSKTLSFVSIQLIGGVVGCVAANLMFGLPALQIATKVRAGPAQLLGEFLATFGLLGVIVGVSRRHLTGAVAAAVALYITSAYWFTSSTSFANPAVTVARMFSDTFTGIRPADAGPFIAAQFGGAALATFLFNWLFPKKNE